MSPRYLLNQTVEQLTPSATLAINEQSQQLADSGAELFRLGFGQSPFPVPQSLVKALQDNAHQKAYLPAQGLLALRQAIGDYLLRTEQLNYQPEQILVGPGTKELMYLLQSVLQAELVLPSPSWVSYAPQAAILGREISWLPGNLADDQDHIPAALEAHCKSQPTKPRLLILNYPVNPTGGSFSAEQLQAIAAVARRYQLIILSDEIYSGLHFDGQHVSIARYYPEGTIISNGLSKWCGAGGWRLGAFAFPIELEAVRKALAVMASETFSAVSSPIQYASIGAFQNNPEINDYLLGARKILRALLNFSYQQLRQAGAELASPDGGFYLFPRVAKITADKNITSSEQLCSAILTDTGVAVLPGSAFGRPVTELSMRIACVDFDGKKALLAASERGALDEGFIEQYCSNTVIGISRLCQWLNSHVEKQ